MNNKKFEPRKRKPIREIETGKSHSGEASPYWDFVKNNPGKRTQDGGFNGLEDPLANPDVLSEEASLYNRPLSEIGALQIEAIEDTIPRLSDKERLVFENVAVEHRTLAHTSELLGVSISTVQTLLTRVRTKIKRRYETLLRSEKFLS